MQTWLTTQKDALVRAIVLRGILTLCAVGAAAIFAGAAIARTTTGTWPVPNSLVYIVAAGANLGAAASYLVIAVSIHRALANVLRMLELASDAKRWITDIAFRIFPSPWSGRKTTS